MPNNVEQNATLWDNYAREWSTEKDFVKKMLADNGQESEGVVLGEEWSDKESFQQVLVSIQIGIQWLQLQDEFIKPFVKDHFKVLELGVGGGRVAKRTASLVAEVHAVDISSEMLKKAQSNLSEFQNVK